MVIWAIYFLLAKVCHLLYVFRAAKFYTIYSTDSMDFLIQNGTNFFYLKKT